MIIDQLGGRKFILFILISILLTILIAINKIDSQEFIKFITVNFGFFVVGNIGENLQQK